MPIGLAIENESNTPRAVSLLNIGDSFTFAVVDIQGGLPVYVFGSNPPVQAVNAKGKPKTQSRLTVLAIKGDAVTGSRENGYEPITAGELYSIYISGYAKYDPDEDKKGGTHLSWGEAVNKLPGGLTVGTVGNWKYLGDIQGSGAQPRKNRKFSLRAPKPEEAEQTARCEELHQQLRNPVPVPTPSADPFGGFDDDDSF